MGQHAIWLVDRSKLFREGLKMLLRDSVFTVTLEAPDISQTEDLTAEQQPSLILVALTTQLEQASEEEQQLTHLCSSTETPVVVLSDQMSLQQLKAAMKAGANGYLLRDITPDALKQSLMLVITGEKVLPSDLVDVLVSGRSLRMAEPANDLPPDLSAREQCILNCLAHGYPNKIIAKRLNIAEGTVKVHIKTVFKKIRARNRTEAAIWALNHGYGHDSSCAS
ncbi:response regulator transcription factor [Iodidimonas sp. SYSU 1G8]|uniref:response regulator transcription factor n=1 Tax=Iodidimonas sp. SYSU 1G8 TaxID=3133967 RepID=UPI0031FEE841